MDTKWECVIVGGGAAGLSAALVLGRARRRTLLIDAGAQSNLAASAIGGLLGSDGVAPAELYARGRKELAAYPSVEVRDGEVVTAAAYDGGFGVHLADGATEHTSRILLATGMRYDVPAIPGLDRLWGHSVFHCPFCHGWEVRGQPLAVLAQGEQAVHMALMLRAWSDDVVLLTGGAGQLTAEHRSHLEAAEIPVDEREVAVFASAGGELESVEFTDGSPMARSGLLVATTLRQRSGLAAKLGVNLVDAGPAFPEAVEIDAMCQTSVPGVFAAGDACTRMPQVAAAIATGSSAAAAVVAGIADNR